jgi:hypothetical protein
MAPLRGRLLHHGGEADAGRRGRLHPQLPRARAHGGGGGGPVDAAAAQEHLATFLRGTPWQPPRTEPPAPLESPVRRSTAPSPPGSRRATPSSEWTRSGEAAGRAGGGGLSFGPSRRSVYNARAEVVRRAEGGELRIQIVVPPREVDVWAAASTRRWPATRRRRWRPRCSRSGCAASAGCACGSWTRRRRVPRRPPASCSWAARPHRRPGAAGPGAPCWPPPALSARDPGGAGPFVDGAPAAND